MPGVSVVKPEYGPTLRELSVRLPPMVRRVLVALVVLIAVAVVVLVARSGTPEKTVVIRKPIALNFAYGPGLRRVQRPGALISLQRTRGSLFEDSYTIRTLTLPPYRGQAGGTLPLLAFGYIKRQERRFSHFSLVDEGRTRVNNWIGYQIVFLARLGTRTLYVRHLMLVPQSPDGLRHGILVEIESTPAAGTPNADSAGLVGALKLPVRSLRFGTSRSGGEQ
jgi:hypothetical protein